MKKNILFYFSMFLYFSMTYGQVQNTPSQRSVLNIEKSDYLGITPTISKTGSQQYVMPFDFPITKGESAFLAFSTNWLVESCLATEVQIYVRFKTKQNSWENWQLLESDPHSKKDAHRLVSTLLFLEKDYNYLEIKTIILSTTCLPNQLQLHFYNPGTYQKTGSLDRKAQDRSFCLCAQPDYQAREDWCPNGDCPPPSNPTSTNVTHLIIHHTATSNTSNDWAGVVRAIWDYHVNNNGWSDIGYNWLIDPNGVLYQGRGDNVLGAHFCGTNSKTMGTAVIGDFTNAEPTDPAKNKLVALHSWKACVKDIDPLGSAYHSSSGLTLSNISGHRDGCATSCPGNVFYPQIPDIRQATVAFTENECGSPIAIPTNLDGFSNAPTQIDLTWEDNANDEDGYILERAINFNVQYLILDTLPADTESFQDITVMPNSGYYYRVKSFRDSVESFYSNEKWIETALTSLQDPFLNEQTVHLFPNPTAGELKINVENDSNIPLNIYLTDVHSRILVDRKVIEKPTKLLAFSLELNELSPGLYWLLIRQGKATTHRKVIIQK